MNNFRVKGIEPSKFIKKIRRVLTKSELGKVASFEEDNNQIKITLSQLGKSHIYFDVEQEENSFIAKKTKEKIAFTHGALKKDVEKHLSALIVRLGAEMI